MNYQRSNNYYSQLIYSIPILVLIVTFSYWGSISSLVKIWYRSDTYNHGFLILPISLWLIWLSKDNISNLIPRFYFPPVILVAIFSALWGVLYISGVQVGHQLFFVLVLTTSIWALLGSTITRKIQFPLLFLFFSVPFGSDLIPPLMIFTADFTVTLIEAFGVPIYREGLYFELPSGRWSVVEACSGINYLLASVTLGTVFAYLTYSSNSKRIIFIFAAILVPIIANGFRAFMIVMIGHLSSMKLAVGVDHLLYGWVFFGIIMMILFTLGYKWRDEIPNSNTAVKQISQSSKNSSYIQVLPLLIAISFGPIIAAYAQSASQSTGSINITFPKVIANWNAVDNLDPLVSIPYFGYSQKHSTIYKDNFENLANLQVFVYQNNQQGKELVNSENSLIDPDSKNDREITTEKLTFSVNQQKIDYLKTQIRIDNTDYDVRYWYLIGSASTTSSYMAKLWEIVNMSLGERKPSLAVFVVTKKGDEKIPDIAPLLIDIHKNILNQTYLNQD